MTFDDDRIAPLRAYGYTDREARFVYLVATHSGYFLSSHFLRFTGAKKGKVLGQFLSRARKLGHIREEPHSNRGALRYHLFARPFYRAIGKENSRNRRRHQVSRINVKLYSLSFVLDHLDVDYLEEENDKVTFFAGVHGIDEGHLPARTYKPSNSTKPPCTRYFVDRFPLFVTGDGSPVFTFIDDRELSTETFRTHLIQYQALLESLPVPSKMLFVSPVRHKLDDAARVFERVLYSSSNGGNVNVIANDPTSDRDLLEYFDLRRRWESDDLTGFTKQMFRKRIDGEKRFASPEYEQLYRKWLDGGEFASGDLPVRSPEHPPRGPKKVSFDTYWIPSLY